MTRMRVAIVNGDVGVSFGGPKGASLHLRGIERAMTRAGVDVQVVTARSEVRESHVHVSSPDKCISEMARWLRASDSEKKSAEAAELSAIGANGAIAQVIHSLHRESPLDAIYERLSLFCMAGSMVAKELCIPHLLEVNAPLVLEQRRYRGLVHQSLAETIECELFKNATWVLPVSEELKRHAVDRGAFDARVHVTPNGAEADMFHPGVSGTTQRSSAGLDPTHIVVGFVGGLRPWHGIAHLIRAFSIARSRVPQLRLLIVGDGPLSESVRARAADATSGIIWCKAVPHTEVPRWIAACDILTAPYEADSQSYFSPLKIAEAALVGRPIIASAICGVLPLVQDQKTGLLVSPGDDAGFARAIERLALDVTYRRALGEFAAVHARTQFTWDAVVHRILGLLRRQHTAVSP